MAVERILVTGAAVGLLAGCEPTYEACAVLCGEEGRCPSGYACGDDGFCYEGAAPAGGACARDGAAELEALALSAPLGLAFEPQRESYELAASVLTQELSVTATAKGAAAIEIDGDEVPSGEPSAPIPLALGENTIAIDVTFGERETSYRLAIDRGAEAVDQLAYGKASNADSVDDFGSSVAVWGDTLAVAAPGEDSAAVDVDGDQADNSADNSGAVYVFRRNGATWEQEAYIKSSNTDARDRFGSSVALWGDVLVVGAPNEDSTAAGVGGEARDNTASSSGAAYVFRRAGTTWTQEAYLKASNPEESDRFGSEVAVWDDTLAVGAPFEDSSAEGVGGEQDDEAADSSGAVYVFRRANATWAQEAYLKASNTGAGDHFGETAALWGDTLAVGAPSEDSSAEGIGGDQDDEAADNSGAVYVFRRTDATWAQEAYLKASNADAGDVFGISVAASGDTLAVGASGEASAATGTDGRNQDDNTSAASGAVYVFRRTSASWAQEAYLKASNTGADDLFGSSVGVWGDALAVGAVEEASAATGIDGVQVDDSAERSGAVYLFRRLGQTWSQQAYLKASNTDAGDRFGSGVALSADSLVAGAPREASAATGIDGDQADNSAERSGAAYIVH